MSFRQFFRIPLLKGYSAHKRLTRVIILERILRVAVASVTVTLIGADIRSGRSTILLKSRRAISLGFTKILANFRRGRGGTGETG